MSGPTTDDEGHPWSFECLMNSDEEDDADMPDNTMTVITVEYALFAEDPDASGELDAETAAEIDKLFKANTTLGGVKSDNCIALAKQVGCTPARLSAEFSKRRAASGTKRAAPGVPSGFAGTGFACRMFGSVSGAPLFFSRHAAFSQNRWCTKRSA